MSGTRPRFAGQSRAVVALFAALSALAVACSKAPAEAALKTADESVMAARRDGEKFAPEAFNALADAAKSAHAEFDRGDYAAAKASAEAIVVDAQDVVTAAATRKAEAAKAWNELQARVPEMGDAIRAKVFGAAHAKRLPKGVSAAELEEAQNGLASFEQDWTEASAAAKSGDLTVALEKGRAASARAQQLRELLGIGAPAEPSPSSQPSSGK